MTAEQIIEYLQLELADAYDIHDMARGNDAQKALAYLIKAHTIEQILDAITRK